MGTYLLGFDLGSSSVKAALVDADTRETLGVSQYPQTEMDVISSDAGWAEQRPESWWENVCNASQLLLSKLNVNIDDITSIGISYQMHGLVVIDKHNDVLRPAIIWSDSRAVAIGDQAIQDIGKEKCLAHLLNSPGNFTMSKLKWVSDNEPELFARIGKFMLPGDYIAMKMTDEVNTTISGLTEAVLWDFKNNTIADFILDYFNFNKSIIPNIVPTFADQGVLSQKAAAQLGIKAGTKITYRAGDQPNNAMSLKVLQPGEIAATGGTSGVVYAVVDKPIYDTLSRVNGFAHVNHSNDKPRVGILLCINGAGSQYSWLHRQVANKQISYNDMERMASEVPIGSDGLRLLPFGNGAERMLQNKEIGAQLINLQFNRHGQPHLFRAGLEGIAFSFVYGIEILNKMGISTNVIRVGADNLFQSAIFSSTIATLTNCQIEVSETTGAAGAALASGVATGQYVDIDQAMQSVKTSHVYNPTADYGKYNRAYEVWKSDLEKLISTT